MAIEDISNVTLDVDDSARKPENVNISFFYQGLIKRLVERPLDKRPKALNADIEFTEQEIKYNLDRQNILPDDRKKAIELIVKQGYLSVKTNGTKKFYLPTQEGIDKYWANDTELLDALRSDKR
jgi:hypothetical protein